MTAPTGNYFYCRYCGDYFTMGREDFNSYMNGEMETPDTCDLCIEMLNSQPEPDYFSDADPGL
jgi:hypothetical protein